MEISEEDLKEIYKIQVIKEGQELEEQKLEVTSINNGHVHTYFIDEENNGETIKTIWINNDGGNHIHKILNNKVEQVNNHNHNLMYTNSKESEEKVEKENEDKIKELKFTLNTGQEAKVNYFTKKIKGILDSIIINSNEMINIRISIEGYNNIYLYNKSGFSGEKWLSLRNDTTFSNGEKSQFTDAKYLLNDKLKIEVEGNYNSSISFIIRWN